MSRTHAKVLLTGGEGFVGSHLAPVLRENSFEVSILHANDVNLQDPNSVLNAIGSTQWDVVIHLAAVSHALTCERDPQGARRVNVDYTRQLLEAARRSNPKVHFVFASTAQVYSSGEDLTESSEIKPQNIYAQTKWEAEQWIRNFAKSSRGHTTILRFFNHTHKSQPPITLLPHLYRTLLATRETPAAGRQAIPVGNLNLQRDIGSVRDLAQAILSVLRQPDWDTEVFNVCSGKPKSLRQLATLLASRLEVDAEFVVEAARLRKGDPLIISGSHAKLRAQTGWQPRVKTAEQLIEDFLAD